MHRSVFFYSAAISLALVHCSTDSSNDQSAPVDAASGAAPSSGGRGTGGATNKTGGAPNRTGGAPNATGGRTTQTGGSSGASTGGNGGASTGGNGGASTGGNGGASTGGSGNTDASTDDASSVPDASGGDGGATDSGGDGATEGETGAPAPIAHFGQVRLVNLAPDSAALDLCMKLTSAANFTTPMLRSSSITAGVPYGSQSQYVDLTLSSVPTTAYDFIIVGAAAASCDPPWLGAFGSVTFNPDTSTTLAIFQNAFPSSGNYSAAVFADGYNQSPRTGNVRVYYVGNFQYPSVDIHASRPAVADDVWFSDFHAGFGSVFKATPVGTYSFRATNTGTQTTTAQKTGVIVTAAAPLDLYLYASDTNQQSFKACPSRPAGPVGTCAL